MKNVKLILPVYFLFIMFILSPLVSAQVPQGQTYTGTVSSLTSKGFTLTLADSTVKKVVVDAKTRYSTRLPAAYSDIEKGDSLGVTSRKESDNSLTGISITIFPKDLLKQIGSREFLMNDGNMMTNAVVSGMAADMGNKTLTMEYTGGKSVIKIDPAVTVLRLKLLGPRDLKNGQKVTVRGKEDGGTVSAGNVNIEIK